ncbi:MAG: response regulator [bacterium]|nr:response regulator [bacterium]
MGTKIVIIDDEPGIRDLLSRELKKEGYEVRTAENGTIGIETVKQEKEVEIVITDIKMPAMDGIEVLKKVKEINPEIEVIITTAYGTIENAIECLRAGASDFINKPFSIDEFSCKIKKIFEKNKLKEIIALYEISKNIFSTIELDKLLKMIIDLSMKVIKADDASLMLMNEEGKLHIAISHRLNEDIWNEIELRPGERVAGWVAEHKQAVILTNGLKNDERFKNMEGIKNIKSALVLPVFGKKDLLGVLNINRISIDNNFTENDLQKATIFVSLAALSIENSKLYNKLQSSREQLVHQSKLAAMGQLAASMVHELNNPLMIIMADIESLIEEKSRREYREIDTAVMQMKRIISSLSQFSRKKELVFEKIKIEEPFITPFSFIDKIYQNKNIRLKKSISDNLFIYGSRGHLEQVFVNILINAIKAMPDGGDLSITAKVIIMNGMKFISIEFKDTGAGISKTDLSRVFEPFFTTDKKNGTGLGLSISYDIIKMHKGDIIIESEGAGKGTLVKVLFPACPNTEK